MYGAASPAPSTKATGTRSNQDRRLSRTEDNREPGSMNHNQLAITAKSGAKFAISRPMVKSTGTKARSAIVLRVGFHALSVAILAGSSSIR